MSQDIQKYIQVNENKIPSEFKSILNELNGLTTFGMIKTAESLGSTIKRLATNEKTIEKQENAALELEIAKEYYEGFQEEYVTKITTDNSNLISLNETKAQVEEAYKEAIKEDRISKPLFLSEDQVEGSELHQLIENFDEQITFFDFEPGEHIEAAQIIGNCSQFFDEILTGWYVVNGLVKNVK